jgi:hypothetical protein
MTNDERKPKGEIRRSTQAGILRFRPPLLASSLAAVAGLTACSSKPPAPDKPMKPETLQQEIGYAGLGQETVIDPVTTNATVVALDPGQRVITLKYANGMVAPYKAGPEVGNFNELKVGDEVKLTAVQEIAVTLLLASAPLSGQDKVVLRRPPGGTGPPLVVDTRTFTARIINIDPWRRLVALQMADNQTKTVNVRETIDLGAFHPGDDVSVRITESRAFEVEKQ